MRDANIPAILKFIVGLFATLVVVFFVMRGVFGYFSRAQSLGPPASPFADTRKLPPHPRLQVEPRLDIERLIHSQQAILDSYGWVNQGTGTVRIPIDRAMELLLVKGLPVRSDPGAQGGAGRDWENRK